MQEKRERYVGSSKVFNSKEDWLKHELGDAYLDDESLFMLGRYIDIGIYDINGRLIGFKENI